MGAKRIKKKVAVVVPSNRPERLRVFKAAWGGLLDQHDAALVVVDDSGLTPVVRVYSGGFEWVSRVDDILGSDWAKFVTHHNSSVKNIGLAEVATMDVGAVVVLDDDVLPVGDPIADHLEALGRRVPISWMATVQPYMRGFPYNAREEAPVMLSHGVWTGVPDLDAPSQLVLGVDHKLDVYCGPVPRGIFAPMCGMNLAFRPEVLPYAYFAPVGTFKGAENFDDIWMGMELVRAFDENNWAWVTGYAVVRHERASDVFSNLAKQWRGLRINESLWKRDGSLLSDPVESKWFLGYTAMKVAWKSKIEKLMKDGYGGE